MSLFYEYPFRYQKMSEAQAVWPGEPSNVVFCEKQANLDFFVSRQKSNHGFWSKAPRLNLLVPMGYLIHF